MLLRLPMKCKICNQQKNNSEFYYVPRFKDVSTCKDCFKSRVSRYREDNLERIKAYDRDRGRSPKRLALQRELGRKFRAERVKYGIAWRERNPEKRAAHIFVGNAIRDGRLIKGVCEVCRSKKVEAHHEDYAKPLEVKWLCKKHHAEIHRKYK